MHGLESIKPTSISSESNKGLPLEEARKYIYSIDFSMIINKLIHYHKWFRFEAEETCKQYRNYLFLLKKNGMDRPLPPSKDIDEFWHFCILDTEFYIRHTKAIFNEYLHHYPYYGIDEKTNFNDLNNSFELTKKLYFQEFGEHLEPTRYRFRWLTKLLIKLGLLE